MKVYRYLSIFPMIVGVLVGSSLGAKDECSATSQTYFAVRPQFQTGSPEYHSSMRTLRHECDENYHNFNVTVFGGRSTSTDNVARFFMPFGCPCVSVNGAIEENGTALFPQNFNLFSVQFSTEVAALILPTAVDPIDTAFVSEICFAPRQTVFGVGLTYSTHFQVGDCRWLFNASAPLMHVRNTMGLSEKVTQEGQFYDVPQIAGQSDNNLDQDVRTMTQAFAQSDWCYGKIDCSTHTKTRLAFIELLFGREWHCSDACHFESFLGVTLPTGNTPDACTVFEPMVGNGGHVGIISHHAFGSQMWQGVQGDCSLNFECDLVFQYLFARTHKRSFDLKYKPWSRYLEMYADRDQAALASAQIGVNTSGIFLATPGINVLTQDVKVRPGFNTAINMAVSLVREEGSCGFNGEAGYNFYAREAECLCLKGCLSDTAAIKDHVGNGVVNPVRNITNDRLINEASFLNILFRGLTPLQVLDEYSSRVLKASDLDLSSAAHPCVIAHTFYGAVGYDWGDRECPVALRLGASYEFSGRTDTALNRWLLWGSFGIDF